MYLRTIVASKLIVFAKQLKILMMTVICLSVVNCSIENSQGIGSDHWVDTKSLTQLTAGIRVDPIGCNHYMNGVGFEGYFSERQTPYGLLVGWGVAPT